VNLKLLAIGAVALLPVGYLLFQLGVGDLLGLTGAGSSAKCKKMQPLTAPTLAQFYDFSEGLARAWKPDAVIERLDHTVTAPLQPDGSSREWTAGFHSAGSKRSMLLHTGDGTLRCSTFRGEPGRLPALKPGFMRDGVALYALAEKNGKPFMEKGLGVRINLWSNGDDNHGTWHVGYYDRQGNSSGPSLIVNANSGAVEER